MEKLKQKPTKEELRKFAVEKRDFMAKVGMTRKISNRITQIIKNSDDYIRATTVALYYPIKNEIDITGIICNDKNFCFPKCTKDEMYFCKVNSLDELKIGRYNIPEPVSDKINPDNIDVIYIPALLANNNCYRLGYGKGYYDKFFKNNKIRAKKIIVIAKNLISDNFIQDEKDYKCDKIVSEDIY